MSSMGIPIVGSLVPRPCTYLLSATLDLQFYFWHFRGTHGTTSTTFRLSETERVMSAF